MPIEQIYPPVQPVNPVTSPAPSVSKLSIIVAAFLIIAAGVFTGYLLSKSGSGKSSSTATTSAKDTVKSAKEVGSTDTKTFSDKAVGTIEKGGSNGEGTHKLIRDGGPSQTVYLISSIVDLDEFAGKKVEVYGQTLRAQKVGWLMDVGRLKLLE